jgi:hypothetical protein
VRRLLATVQLCGFLVAGIAMVAPGFPRLVRDWSGGTIYPWWAELYVVVGVVASLVSILLRNESRALLVPTFLVVMAGQLAGLGLMAVKHWEPSFGMGGGYAGQLPELVDLAWIIGVAGTVATLAATAQLVAARAFPIRASVRDALLFGGVGLLILLTLPIGISEGDAELQDLTSFGAFVLIYSGPIGATVAATAWLVRRLRFTAIASCAVAAAISALDLITDLSYLRGRPALIGTAVLLAAFALGSRWLMRSEPTSAPASD